MLVTTVKKMISVVCVLSIVDIVASKYQGSLYVSNFARVVIVALSCASFVCMWHGNVCPDK